MLTPELQVAAAQTYRNHRAQVAGLGPTARAAHEAECAECAGDGLGPVPSLATYDDVLAEVVDALERHGLAGEQRLVKLLYLVVTTRLLERPVSVAVKGPSSGGKSYIVELVLRLFPDDAYHAVSAMSDHALVYGFQDVSLVHRMLVVYEAAGARLGGSELPHPVPALGGASQVRHGRQGQGRDARQGDRQARADRPDHDDDGCASPPRE